MFLLLSILASFLSSLDTCTLRTDCVLTLSSNASQPFSYPGSLVMKGSCFRLDMLGYEVAYDGSTFYLYSDDTQELTLTSPTEEELMQINPLLFAKALVSVSRVEEKTATDGTHIVNLYPNDLSAGIVRVSLVIDKEGLYPLSLEIKEADKSSRLVFHHPTSDTGHQTPDTIFVLSKPDVFLNDLR